MTAGYALLNALALAGMMVVAVLVTNEVIQFAAGPVECGLQDACWQARP